MDSLRSRPSQQPRKVQKAPSRSGRDGPGPRPRTTRVDDKIKKRMSMRYADISSPIDSNDLPDMPSIMGFMPDGQPSGIMYDEDEGTRQREASRIAAEDKKILSDDNFDPDAYLKLKLANSTESELRSLQASLEKAKDNTASDLQRSVFKSYAEFVVISKEISVLENEMLELKELISDYRSMPQMLHVPDPTTISSNMLSTYKRSSVADLKVLYFNQMQDLHSSVEGAAKFVPVTPGRHVVGEFENVMSLNAATYKIAHKVKFVVLDDAVLVAKRRRRKAGADGPGTTVNEGKLVAELCWALNDMVVLDTKDSPSMTNVFKIRSDKKVNHVYRTETAQEKKAILAMFRQVAEELSSKKRKEREGEHERRKSMWQGGGGRNSPAPPLPEWMAELAKKGGEVPNVAADAKVKAENDARWVGDWSDELTVAIALKEWNQAVKLVEDGQARAGTIPSLATRLPPLTAQLTASLLECLALPSNKKTSISNLVSLLIRLKAGAAARNTLLDMRGKVIHSLMRKIPFEGHVATYIGALTVVFFMGIKNTADWYLFAFKENDAASAFITWAKSQLEKYADIFRKQVYSKDVDPKVVEEAIEITRSQSKKLLEEFGLDFRHILDSLLMQNPRQAPNANAEFHVTDRRQSKQILQATRQPSRQELKPKKSSSTLQTPAPPTLGPAPIGRNRSPAPSISQSSVSSSSTLTPGRPAALNLDSPTTPTYSGRPDMAPPIPSARSAMFRSRTPVSAGTGQPRSQTPTNNYDLAPTAPLSPTPRRTAAASPHPPVVASAMRQSNSNPANASSAAASYYRDRERERPSKSARGSPVPSNRNATASPVPVPLPPRSVHRPGSSMGRPPPPPSATIPREGMF